MMYDTESAGGNGSECQQDNEEVDAEAGAAHRRDGVLPGRRASTFRRGTEGRSQAGKTSGGTSVPAGGRTAYEGSATRQCRPAAAETQDVQETS